MFEILSPSDFEARFFLAFACQGLALGAMALALTEAIGLKSGLPSWLVPITAGAGVAILGYAAFWIYFASPLAGRTYSWTVFAVAVLGLALERLRSVRNPMPLDALVPFALAGIIGMGYLSLAHLFKGLPFFDLARNRFLEAQPPDNQIPAIFSDRLWSGESPRRLLGDWLSSDRPPLQTGWLLLTRPLLAATGLDDEAVLGAGSVWFQLIWVPALWALFRRLNLTIRQATALIAAISFSGIFLYYTLFTWPKFGAAALVLSAFVLWWTPANGGGVSRARRFALGGGCAALGYLAHGGVAFSLLGLAPLAVAASVKGTQNWRSWLLAAAAFMVLVGPWLAYQTLYEPPGNRLLKWHLAGVIAPDSRDFPSTLIASYRHLGWSGAMANRTANLRAQWAGVWPSPRQLFSRDFLVAHREEEIFFTARSFVWWLPFLLVLPWTAVRANRSSGAFAGWAAGWWFLGWFAWLGLMFLSNQAIVRQGTLVTQMLGFALLAWSALALHRFVFLTAAAVQAATFLVTWLPPAQAVAANIDPLAAGLGATAAILLIAGMLLGAEKRSGSNS